ncbi:lysozyme [Pantoea sp. MBD-2R]|uniref:lysozyme n=1 Tax=Pantoea sp. MBD-2R TaxID=3141540 RepID=UPI0031833B88
MNISDKGIRFLKAEEGERLTGYLDVVGIPTIGVGHTGTVDGIAVSVGMKIDAEKSTELLLLDLDVVERAIKRQVTMALTQNQYDALCSLIFNIGTGAFSGSTVRRKLNEGDYQGAADAFLMWKRAGSATSILLPRRERERKLFLS